MKNIYEIKNNLTKTYSDPIFRFEDPKTLCKQLHDFIILEPEKALEQKLNISTVVYVGTYDECTGLISFVTGDEVQEYNLQEAWEQYKALKEQVNA